MESNEEYLLRTLRRTTGGLTDSLIPAHGAKLTKLLNRFESSYAVTDEVRTLMQVQGFGKCALAMEWLLERTKRTEDYFAPEQFESDVLLLNEKLFEAFLNQPFDMPDYSHTFEAPVRPIQHIQVSDEEFMGTSYAATPEDPSLSDETSGAGSFGADPFAITSEEDPVLSSLEGNDPFAVSTIDTPVSDPFAMASESTGAADPFGGPTYTSSPESPEPSSDVSPSLKDSMTTELFEATERAAQTATEFIEKQTMDRPISMAVFRVTARAAAESAKASGNVVAEDLFNAILRLIAYSDEQGKIKTDTFAVVIQDIGDRMKIALKEPSGGITLLKNLTKHLNDPKELLASR